MHHYNWRPVGAKQAQRALDNGGAIWQLPASFGNGAACYSHGLGTKRGACYVVSDLVFATLVIPATAWPQVRKAETANHRSPFGPGA